MNWVALSLMGLVVPLASCGKKQSEGSPCDEAFRRLQKNVAELGVLNNRPPSEGPEAELEKAFFREAAELCKADRWPSEIIQCTSNASTSDELTACTERLSELQRTKFRKPAAVFLNSREERAAATLKKFASEAFPLWSQANPDKACPSNLDVLLPFMNIMSVQDPWGRPYRMICGANLPDGAQGIAISSDGPDGRPATNDDLRSW